MNDGGVRKMFVGPSLKRIRRFIRIDRKIGSGKDKSFLWQINCDSIFLKFISDSAAIIFFLYISFFKNLKAFTKAQFDETENVNGVWKPCGEDTANAVRTVAEKRT